MQLIVCIGQPYLCNAPEFFGIWPQFLAVFSRFTVKPTAVSYVAIATDCNGAQLRVSGPAAPLHGRAHALTFPLRFDVLCPVTCDAGWAPENGKCAKCPEGTFVGKGSTKLSCADFKCAAGTTDHDSNPATPCVKCTLGVDFTDKPGNVGSCKAATKCKAGQDPNGSASTYLATPLGVGSVVYRGYE